MARLYLEVAIEETNHHGMWVSCVAGATGILEFYATDFWVFIPGDPDPATIASTVTPMAIALVHAQTGVTLSALMACISGLPVGL